MPASCWKNEIVNGAVVIRDGRIAAIDTGASAIGEDMEGDFVIAGLVELHTDHLESHYSPRPGVRWMKTAAIQAHDAQVVTSGITTVFDCLRLVPMPMTASKRARCAPWPMRCWRPRRKTGCAPTT